MSFRLRLALWFGLVLGAVALLGSAASYAFHVRTHYEEIDHALVVVAQQVATEMALGQAPVSRTWTSSRVTVVRLYDASGRAHASLPPGAAAPGLDPRAALAFPAGPAYGPFPRLAPSIVPIPAAGGAFATLHDGTQRWRAYVLPLAAAAGQGYVVGLAPLGELDRSMETFRWLLALLGLGGVLTAVVVSYAIAGHALRPIVRLTETARAITRSGDLARRVEARGRDELGQLAATFNAMLDSLEAAYRAQQRFVADASHELRAPLTAILGNLELLRRRQDMSEEEQRQALEEVEREARRLTRLVADLLALARADAGVAPVLRPVDLDAVVLESFNEARLLARGHRLVLDPFEPARVRGDADRLKELLLILLDNATKYTPPGGQIQVGLRVLNGQVEVTVKDTGIGIGPEDLPHVFERFYRADPARSRDPGGTGLGLPIARAIVEQHGGRIELQSERGRGTTAIVRLPRLA